MTIRTDLALEAKIDAIEDDGKLKGIKVTEKYDKENHINIIRMDVLNKSGAEVIGKPVGTYITMEVPELTGDDDDSHHEISRILAKQIKELIIGAYHWEDKIPQILIAGLGNRETAPDALGPMTISHLLVTRHIIEFLGYEEIEGAFGITSAVVPGVMAQTGMESSEIICGIVRKTKPDLLIVVDALAARSVHRLNSTIQITDTGIHPGSGVGNAREAITKRTMGVPVIAIGVPTVVDAATLVYDSVKKSKGVETGDITSECEKMYVTPKDIDAIVKRVSLTISEALNICMGNE